jgi:multisubunit Na+/H+ antiporter MnhG subunit
MNLDIRLPIGMLFFLLGVLLAGYGVLSDPSVYQRSLGYNVNLIWGLVLLAFGVFMLVRGRRGTSRVPPAKPPHL